MPNFSAADRSSEFEDRREAVVFGGGQMHGALFVVFAFFQIFSRAGL